jgi:cytochrome b subunit of formate dehydrogenase
MKKLYFPFVMLVELVILAAFIWFLIYLFPTLDPKGYLFYGDAPHVPYLQQYVSTTAVTVVRWVFYLITAFLVLFMMVTIIGELIRWRINQSHQPHTLPGSPGEEQITRFDVHFKLQHYLIMIGVTLAGIIGLLQAFPDWAAGSNFLNNIWGGLDLKRHFHHYFAYIVDFTVFYFLFYLAYKFFIKKEKMRAMLPNFKDIKDMIHMNLYILGIKKDEPQYNRYTFGQKIDFFIILLGVPTLSLTGLAMHYTSVSEHVIGGMGIALAVVIHRSVAIFLAWFVLSVHLYYAHLAPGLFPVNTVILTGKMSKSRYRALFPLDNERLSGKAVTADTAAKSSSDK